MQAMEKRMVKLSVNGDDYEFAVKPNRTLLEALNDNLGLTGTRYGCGTGECGACTVLIDGEPKQACLMLAISAEGKNIRTVEGLSDGEGLHPVQRAFVEHGALQCGFCTPGFVMKAVALLQENPHPTEEEIRHYLRGNLCRCTGYAKIVKAIADVAR
jgi:carbon-monoxide dehydrogenase small subunit